MNNFGFKKHISNTHGAHRFHYALDKDLISVAEFNTQLFISKPWKNSSFTYQSPSFTFLHLFKNTNPHTQRQNTLGSLAASTFKSQLVHTRGGEMCTRPQTHISTYAHAQIHTPVAQHYSPNSCIKHTGQWGCCSLTRVINMLWVDLV